MTEVEIWGEIPGWSYYAISSLGRIYRRPGTPGCKAGRFLKTHMNYNGYPAVHFKQDGREKQFTVHKAVALTFLGDRPSLKHELAHRDGDRANPRLSNLRWATHAENEGDKLQHGTRLFGERHSSTIISESNVELIRVMRREGKTYAKIAVEMGISTAQARRIALGISRSRGSAAA